MVSMTPGTIVTVALVERHYGSGTGECAATATCVPQAIELPRRPTYILEHVTNATHLLEATSHLQTPFALIDSEAMWRNAQDLVRRANGVPIRVATKSIRVLSIIKTVLTLDGFQGAMSYSLAEANWLVDNGVDDVLVAYPSVDAEAYRELFKDEKRLNSITVMVDSIEALEVIDSLCGSGHAPIRICIDVDSSFKVGPAHLGVRRSPIHSPRQAKNLAAAIGERPGFKLVGLMFYDAQIAGVPDTSPAVRVMKNRSSAELMRRRRRVIRAVSQHADLTLINGGGTGSLETTGKDKNLTELAAGSGLFTPTLFDEYDAFEPNPSSFFALSVVRKPAPNIVTCFAGGYIASGPAGQNRVPTPVWPEGLEYLGTEGAGEVQSPLKGKAAESLAIGDRVLFRHAKAGEMCERFNQVALVSPEGSVTIVPTYRGEGKNFG
ncbi:MAG: amino acid deaminase/aldolase [Aeromicrobium sp.]|nr:MAG: amino acid deaminase/aldolase [Aeromicrobium sp.]